MDIQFNIETGLVLDAMQIAPQKTAEFVRRALSRGANEVVREARSNVPKAFSELTNSIRAKEPPRSAGVLAIEVVVDSDHAAYVERGAGPGGWVPTDTLSDWIRIKGITPNSADTDEEDLVFMIKHHIYRHGTPAQPYLQPAFDSKESRINQLIQQAVQRALLVSGL